MQSTLYCLMRIATFVVLLPGTASALLAARASAQTPVATPAPVVALEEREASQVAVIVGMILAAAVVIAIVAYLVARRRRAVSTA